MLAKLHGSRNFQLKSISRSTRKRGKVQRNQRKQKTSASVLTRNQAQLGTIESQGSGAAPPPRNSAEARRQASSMYAYSARKKSENFMPEYSVWKPATSSDSASGMSKGMRLVSATEAIRKMTNAS